MVKQTSAEEKQNYSGIPLIRLSIMRPAHVCDLKINDGRLFLCKPTLIYDLLNVPTYDLRFGGLYDSFVSCCSAPIAGDSSKLTCIFNVLSTVGHCLSYLFKAIFNVYVR
jgi:hypothetical protein